MHWVAAETVREVVHTGVGKRRGSSSVERLPGSQAHAYAEGKTTTVCGLPLGSLKRFTLLNFQWLSRQDWDCCPECLAQAGE